MGSVTQSTPWIIAHQFPLSMGFPSKNIASRLPFHSPGDLPNPGVEPVTLVYPALAGRFFTTELPVIADSVQFSSVQSLSRV